MIPCTACNRWFRNTSGLKRHFNAVHAYHPGLDIPITEFQREYHPFLTGLSVFSATFATLSQFFYSCSQAM